MSNPILLRRPIVARLLVGSAFVLSAFSFAVLLAGAQPAQQEEGKKGKVVEEQDNTKPKQRPPVEEIEDKGQKQKRKVIRVEDDDAPNSARKPSATDSFSGDLAALMKSKHSGISRLAAGLIRPHDVIGCEYAIKKGQIENKTVEPLAKYYGDTSNIKRELIVIPYDQEWKPLKTIHLAPTVIKSITPYEELAQEQVAAFLEELVDERWPEKPEGSAQRLSRREGFAVLVAVDADKDERLVCQPGHERPLVRVHGPTVRSPVPPEIEQHHLAPVVA